MNSQQHKKKSMAKMDDTVTVVRLPHSQAYTILHNRLYLAPAFCATNEELLRKDGISRVLNVAKDVDTQQFSTIQVHHLKLYDSPDQSLPFQQAAEYLSECLQTNGKCLVHCNAGQSRSASLIMYFLMKYGPYSLQEAWDYCKTRKPDIRPNFGFAIQLEAEEVKIHGKSSFDLTEYKADSIMDILEGSGKTKADVIEAIQKFNGDAELALGSLLT